MPPLRQPSTRLGAAAVIAALTLPTWAAPARAAPPTITVADGDEIWAAGGTSCVVGFNLHDSSGGGFLLTSGGCGQGVSDWYADSGLTEHVATAVNDQVAGSDYAIAQYDSGVEHPSTIDLVDGAHQQITQTEDATIGESVTTTSRQTGIQRGVVTNLNLTMNTGSGPINGLIDTNLCSQSKDAGSPLFDGTGAIGVASFGKNDCSSGGETLYQPIAPILSQYGLSIG